MDKKTLIVRLSSLGDIILATSVLDSFKNKNLQIEWAVAQEYSELIQDHPGIQKLWKFNRKTGFVGWISFCRNLWNEGYDTIYDLHRTLRTRVMKILFFYWSLREKRVAPRWHSISKQRVSLYGYFIFKALWPRAFRPTPWIHRYLRLVGADVELRPNLNHLLKGQPPLSTLDPFFSQPGRYYCIMPSSKWSGKEWPVVNYVQVIKAYSGMPVILGLPTDRQSTALIEELQARGLPFVSGVGRWSLEQTAWVLSQSQGYLGNDTGLAHLAQSLGVKAIVLYGPTTPETGFGPWGVGSEAIGVPLICRPCGKDGQLCYRLGQRYQCLKGIAPYAVLEKMKSTWGVS